MEISSGTSRRRASANASSPHSYQSTGLSACCCKYGEVAAASRFTAPTLLTQRPTPDTQGARKTYRSY
jgi:hypothetical protein